jgi:lactoylglutathione lyase
VGSWASGIGAITLFVEDLAAAKRFYGEVFGLPVKYEDDDSAVFDY